MSTPDLQNITHPPAWVAEGLCAQTDPELFFPDKGGSVRDAKRVCRACPVRAQCLAYALDHGERHGVWGGESERARRALAPTADRPVPAPPAPRPDRAWRAGEVRRLAAGGLSDRQVAERIGCTTRTVERIRAEFTIPPESRPAGYRGVAA